MLKALKQDGFASFIEVIITAIIFMIAGFGIFTAISMLRPQGVDSAKKLEAAYVAMSVYSTLRGKVDANYWNNSAGLLWPGVLHTNTILLSQYDNTAFTFTRGYQVNWILTNDITGVRQLEMNVEEL